MRSGSKASPTVMILPINPSITIYKSNSRATMIIRTNQQWIDSCKFRVAERSKKRTHTSTSSSAPDRSSHSAGYDKGKASKKTESSSAPHASAVPQVATVTAHCDGCGKLGHKRDECKSSGPIRTVEICISRTYDFLLKLIKQLYRTTCIESITK